MHDKASHIGDRITIDILLVVYFAIFRNGLHCGRAPGVGLFDRKPALRRLLDAG